MLTARLLGVAMADHDTAGLCHLQRVHCSKRGRPRCALISLATAARLCLMRAVLRCAGRYTDSILPEVFVRVGMANQLLPGAVAMFHLSKQVAEEEPQPVEASRRRSSTRNSRKGSALGV